jgi:hypothetical protein
MGNVKPVDLKAKLFQTLPSNGLIFMGGTTQAFLITGFLLRIRRRFGDCHITPSLCAIAAVAAQY